MFDTDRISRANLITFFASVLAISAIFFVLPIGWVGEVVPFWGPIPKVLSPDPLSCLGNVCLYPSRPILRWGTFPLMLNVYTPSIPDWIHWLNFRVTSSGHSIRIGQVLFSAIALCILRHWSTHWLKGYWCWLFIIFLCADWNWIFYKKALGNTEILLQLGWFACIVGVWKQLHQSSGSRWIVTGLIIGLWSKITFILLMFPLGIVLMWQTKSRKNLYSPILFGLLIGIIPYLLLLLWTVNIEIPVRSHDFWTLKWERIVLSLQGSTSIRETPNNWILWLFDPLPFFEIAYSVPTHNWLGWGKCAALILAIGVCWSNRNVPSIQFLSVLLTSQVLILSVIAQDLHHLAIATPLFWLWFCLVLQHIPLQRIRFGIITVVLLNQGIILWQGCSRILEVNTPTFSQLKQQQLTSLLLTNQVQHLVTMDYEIYGILEVEVPNIDVLHSWPSISTQRWAALPKILKTSIQKHLVVVESSMPMTYNLQPTSKRLQEACASLNLQATLVDDSMSGVKLYWIDSL